MAVPIGMWTTDAPLSPEMVEEDMALIRQIVIPAGVHLNDGSLYVNGRLWRWELMAAAFGDVRREFSDVR